MMGVSSATLTPELRTCESFPFGSPVQTQTPREEFRIDFHMLPICDLVAFPFHWAVLGGKSIVKGTA